MKDYCVSCGATMIYQTEERFEDVGNYCQKCINKANKRITKNEIPKEKKWKVIGTFDKWELVEDTDDET